MKRRAAPSFRVKLRIKAFKPLWSPEDGGAPSFDLRWAHYFHVEVFNAQVARSSR